MIQAMTQTVEAWVRQVANKPLPVMQRTLTQVRDLLIKKTSVNHSRLAAVISCDPGFSLYVLQQLSNLANPPKEPITKVSLAVPMLGMEVIEQASNSLPCLEDKLKGPPRRGLIDCYSRAAHAAFYARGLADIRKLSNSDALYTAALLHDIGEMALWSEVPDQMLNVHKKIEAGDDRESVARDELGCTFEMLNTQLSEDWKLPDLIKDSQGMANSYQPKPLTVMLAANLSRETSLGWNRDKTAESMELFAEFLEIPLEQAASKLHVLAAESARELQRLPLPLPAFFIISGDAAMHKKNHTAPSVQAPNTKAIHDKKAAPEPAKIDIPEVTSDTRKGKAEQPVTAPVKKTQQPTSKKTNPLQILLNNALEQMHYELGLSRTMFAMLSPDREILRSRLVIESEQQLSLNSFTLNIKNPSLFKILLNKPQAILLNRDNATKYLPMIPPTAKEQINTSGFVSMSIFIRNKPVGLFYADNGLSGPAVTRQQFANFKVICEKMMKTLNG
jgi:HD-like signal output (HDOD) protein